MGSNWQPSQFLLVNQQGSSRSLTNGQLSVSGRWLGRLPSRDFPPHGVKAVQSSLYKKAYADMKEGKGAGQQNVY